MSAHVPASILVANVLARDEELRALRRELALLATAEDAGDTPVYTATIFRLTERGRAIVAAERQCPPSTTTETPHA